MSTSSSSQGDIRQVQLKGHSSSVTCLALHNTSTTTTTTTSVLLSGSEDGTARLWDLRQQRASLCILMNHTNNSSSEITSVSFDPPVATATATATLATKKKHNTTAAAVPVSSSSSLPLLQPFAQEYTVWLSAGTSVCGYDLRNATSPIVRDCSVDYTNVFKCEDEVNQISLARSGRRSVFLAAAEDGGVVRVLDTQQPPPQPPPPNHDPNRSSSSSSSSSTPQRQPYRTLYHGDESVMVTSAVFRPPLRRGGNAINTDLVSGGTDCTIHLWDVTRPRYDMNDA
eukprot:scaffold294151_cov71-Attheya_sp.AAC.2